MDSGKITSVDLVKNCLKRIKELNKKLNACLTICSEEALREAEIADKRRERGEKG